MNAFEVIEQIKQLPSDERGKVIAFVRKIPNDETVAALEEARNHDKLDSYRSADEMFEVLGIKC